MAANSAAQATITRFIAYERGSTARQGASGLGMEAQRHSIDGFAASRGADLIGRFIEVDRGKNPNRPQLTAAIQLARLTCATLVIANLDRLSRTAAFLLTLRDSGVHFLAVDMPEANDLTVGIMALAAQAEREAISRRTKEALAVAKAHGAWATPTLRHAGKGAVALRAARRCQCRPFLRGAGCVAGAECAEPDRTAGWCGLICSVEHSHQPFRRREGATLRFRRMRTLRKFASAHASVHNRFN